jgi:hypothetical protein
MDPATPPLADETLRCLMLRHPSVVAFVNGHEHNNRITPVRRTGAHFTTILDHASEPRPGPLASISRELSYNDPDSSNGEDGHPDARGEPTDRNTELSVANPWGHTRR